MGKDGTMREAQMARCIEEEEENEENTRRGRRKESEGRGAQARKDGEIYFCEEVIEKQASDGRNGQLYV